MKIALFVILTCFFGMSFSALAADPTPAKTDTNFPKHKQETLDHLDKMISAMQEMRTCVAGAKAHEDMKACHEAQEKNMHAMEMQHKEHRKEMIDDQIKRLQDEKAKMNEAPPKGN